MANHFRGVEKSCQFHWKFSGPENQKREDKNGGAKSLGEPPQKETVIWWTISSLSAKISENSLW